MTVNRQIRLKSRPQGAASADNFELVSEAVPALRDRQVLVRHHYMSLDPYMRWRMTDAKSYVAPQPLGGVMGCGTVGEVVDSQHPDFRAGDFAYGMGGWQEYGVYDADARGALRKLAAKDIPISYYLGALGMPGVTGWYGLTQIIAPKAGETVVVSAASGAVGSVVGVLAKVRGCRVVGIAGGPEKCDHVTRELGFDACIDHRANADAASMERALDAACPDGIDGDFENVGGTILDAIVSRSNDFARIALCGLMSAYDGEPAPLRRPDLLLKRRIRLQGFILSDHRKFWGDAVAELEGLVRAGRFTPKESVAQGLEAAPEAFLGMLAGRNFGKQLVKLV